MCHTERIDVYYSVMCLLWQSHIVRWRDRRQLSRQMRLVGCMVRRLRRKNCMFRHQLLPFASLQNYDGPDISRDIRLFPGDC